jgi:hypothetical protein
MKMLKYLIIFLSGCNVSLSYAGTVDAVLDGHFDGDSVYDHVFSVDYYHAEGSNKTGADGLIRGGVLAIDTSADGQSQFVYFAHPLGFKDLSYGNDDKYTVGWQGSKKGQENLGKAINSEYITLGFKSEDGTVYELAPYPHTSSSDEGLYEAQHNYSQCVQNSPAHICRDENNNLLNKQFVSGYGSELKLNNADSNGFFTTGDGEVNVKYLSTVDYNRANFGGKSWFEDRSVRTKSPDNITGCADESSSHIDCYTVFNSNQASWDFNWGVEFEIKRADGDGLFFDPSNIDLNMFGYRTADALISLNYLHASDAKMYDIVQANLVEARLSMKPALHQLLKEPVEKVQHQYLSLPVLYYSDSL